MVVSAKSILESSPWHFLAVSLVRCFNLSEVLLSHLSNQDNLIDSCGTLGGVSEITFEGFSVQSDWHTVNFNMLVPMFPFQNMGPCQGDGELVPRGHLDASLKLCHVFHS